MASTALSDRLKVSYMRGAIDWALSGDAVQAGFLDAIVIGLTDLDFADAKEMLEFFDHACHIGEICVKGNTSISNFRDKIFDMTQQGGEADSETSSVKKKPRSAKKMMKKSDIDFGSDIGSDGMVTPQAQTPKRRKKATKKSAGGKRDIVGSSDEDEDGFHSANLPSKKSKPAPAKGSTLNFSSSNVSEDSDGSIIF